MSEGAPVRIEAFSGGIRVLTLDRPDALNAITLAMAERLDALLAEVAADPDARCIVITGAGDRAFSAGFDIKEMAGFDAEQIRQAFVARDPLFLRVAQHPLPVIAALNGIAHGAGALIAAACDFRVAGPATEFKVTAIKYGSANATWSLPRIVGPARAKDIIMTGRAVGADEGLRIGLFDRSASGGSVLEDALRLANEIAARPTHAIRAAKTLIDCSRGLTREQGWQAEHDHVLGSLESGGQAGRDVFDAFLTNKRP